MANVLVDEAALQGIADSIRAKNGTQDTYKPAQMAQAISAIESDSEDGFYDDFWNGFQQNGTRTDYANAFKGVFWTSKNFWPKYDIKPVDNTNSFWNSTELTIDLMQRLKDCGVELDVSNANTVAFMFSNSGISTIPPLNPAKTTSLQALFSNSKNLHTVEKLTVQSAHTYTNTFSNCTALTHVTFDGTIGNAISFAQSPLLSDASVQSIIDHLADLTGSGAQTLALHAQVKEKLTETQIAAITSKNWTLA